MRFINHLPIATTILLISLGFVSWGQEATLKTLVAPQPPDTVARLYGKGMTHATLSVGLMDMQRANYGTSSSFGKGTISGFAPVYGRLEHGLTTHFGIGVAFVYGVFNASIYREYQENGRTYRRYATDRVRLFNTNIFGTYHLGRFIKVKRLDPFVSIGLGINTISHSNKTQADSMVADKDYTVSPFLRAGARYYISSRGSLFADVGYDGKAIMTVGASCILKRKR